MLSTHVWLSLSQITRNKLATILGLQRSGGTEVSDGRVVSDGYTPTNLSVVTVPLLQSLLSSEETDFYVLFNKIIEQVEGKEIIMPSGEIVFAEIEIKDGETIVMPKEEFKSSDKIIEEPIIVEDVTIYTPEVVPVETNEKPKRKSKKELK